MVTLFKENDHFIDRFFDNFYHRFYRDTTSALSERLFTTAHSAVREESDKYVFQVAMPGLRRKDINVHVENGVLNVSSLTGHHNRLFGIWKCYLTEQCQSFVLPLDADKDKITARYHQGLLEISIAKIRKPGMVKTIPVQGKSGGRELHRSWWERTKEWFAAFRS